MIEAVTQKTQQQASTPHNIKNKFNAIEANN